jgi:mannan endo-1,4-beta-mannosidase
MYLKGAFLHAVIWFFFGTIVYGQTYQPADKLATPETNRLYASLQHIVNDGIIFGHHDDLAYGVGWRGDNGRSDVKSVTGSYPALYGWDLSGIERDSSKDINSIPFRKQREFVKEVYERGGINTFCWHLNNPVNGKTAWDTSQNTVRQIIPGGAHHEAYKLYLDRVAKYVATLKGSHGEPIPILFRPFHELTGNWFWWCANTCSADEFKALWRFTIDYLRNTKGLHNLLIVYSVADFNSTDEFLARYPGDDYADIVGFDSYCKNVPAFQREFERRVAMTQAIAAAHHKLSAIAETGYERLPQADWWTDVLLPIISRYKISYLMVWRNGGPDHFYAPYPGQMSAEDFKRFFKSNKIIFQNRLTGMDIYGKSNLK